MKLITTTALTVLTLTLTSCTTPKPPQTFYRPDNSALVIESLDDRTCQLLQPTASGRENIDRALAAAKTLPQHLKAVVILENYTEPECGAEFRERGTAWFVGLRNLGYEHIVFLKGAGVTDPNGLPVLVEYD